MASRFSIKMPDGSITEVRRIEVNPARNTIRIGDDWTGWTYFTTELYCLERVVDRDFTLSYNDI